jgi:hypothetical protein
MTGSTPQSESSLLPRATARINPNLEKKLSMYLAAAGAAGVGVMALSNTADAKVVYTPTNISMGFDTPQPVDLNGDGIADVSLVLYPLDKSFGMFANAPAGNGVRLAGFQAAAGFFGVPVGPGEKFGGSFVGLYYKVFGYGNSSSYGVDGPWANVSNRYMGVKFVIAGTTHYGWVRMTTSKSAAPLITGYAYETTPNTSIKDGAISGPAKVSGLEPAEMLAPKPQPASLGLLAHGSDGIAIWRREEDAV